MPIRVLIVDDSAFMRNALGKMLSSDPEIVVAGIAKDGVEALEKIAQLKPDLVTMDIEMPRMDGIEALRRIMATMPLPVIMVSSLTVEGAKATLEALEIGAVDFLSKNLADLSLNILQVREALLEKVKQIARRRVRQAGLPPVRAYQAPAPAATPGAGEHRTEYRK
ncbi:MAG: response regulator, partial [Deltaproteobacteria bacterium]|nr:response regulator [Deltaproteobacteria bacterium]